MLVKLLVLMYSKKKINYETLIDVDFVKLNYEEYLNNKEICDKNPEKFVINNLELCDIKDLKVMNATPQTELDNLSNIIDKFSKLEFNELPNFQIEWGNIVLSLIEPSTLSNIHKVFKTEKMLTITNSWNVIGNILGLFFIVFGVVLVNSFSVKTI
mgnify:CR=1 FL=1